ncbi:MAG: sensor histidine kinase [bacterium]
MKRILGSVWFLALFIFVPFILFLPPLFEQYKIVPEKSEPFGTNLLNHYYVDLNSDGEKEKIVSYVDVLNERLCLQYFEKDEPVPVDQLNYPHNYHTDLPHVFFFDSDGNGFTEVYGFTMKDDSLYLNWFEPYPDWNSNSCSKFITLVQPFNDNKFDFWVREMHFIDLNGDNSKELVFPGIAGYSLAPRNIFVFDKQKNTVFKSPYYGVNLYDLRFSDINNDSNLEIISNCSSSGNQKEIPSNAYSDMTSWLMVFKSDFSPLFSPIPFTEGLQNRVHNFIIGEDLKSLITFNFAESDLQKVSVFRIGPTGEKVDSVFVPKMGGNERHAVFRAGKNVFYVVKGNNVVPVNSDLIVGKIVELPVPKNSYCYGFFKVYGNKNQLIFTDISRKKFFVLFEDLKTKAGIEFHGPINPISRWNFLGDGRFFIISNNIAHYYELQKNKWYLFKYPYYLLVYLISVLFVWLIQYARERQLRQKYELQNQVRELELRSFQSQMDPHFMFNAFTTMASLLKKGSQEQAYNAFIKFSKLIRLNFEYSQKITRPLKDELQVITDFLEINKMRFKDKLDYSINLKDESLVHTKVPKMILQIHVENALKHGLNKKPGKGEIRVMVKKENEFLYLTIEDNGIGRHKAKQLKRPSTRQGLKMLQALYDRLNKKNRLKITQKFTDLKDENGNAAGTRVEVWVPVNLKG